MECTDSNYYAFAFYMLYLIIGGLFSHKLGKMYPDTYIITRMLAVTVWPIVFAVVALRRGDADQPNT